MSPTTLQKKLGAIDWQEKFAIGCYGETLDFRIEDREIKSRLLEALPVISRLIEYTDSKNVLSLVTNQNFESNGLYFNDEVAMEFGSFEDVESENLADKILIVLAKISLPRKFYLHAGAVVWNGTGILIPGESCSGKTTLVKELIEAGAEYYSDDCIILENNGWMLPLPRPLAIRTAEGRVIRDAAAFGAKIGITKARLGAIFFTGYESEAVWKPQKLSPAQAALQLLDNFYYKGSISDEPREIIRGLTEIVGQTKILISGKRNEASEVVSWIQEKFGNDFDEQEVLQNL